MAEKPRKNSNKRPDLVLSMSDKIYLAVAANIDSGTGYSFVHALVCTSMGLKSEIIRSAGFGCIVNPNADGIEYSPIPLHEMYTFKDKEEADIYWRTLEQISGIQSCEKSLKKYFSGNENAIKDFEAENLAQEYEEKQDAVKSFGKER